MALITYRMMAEKLSAAMSWLDAPFIDQNTSAEELRSRIGFMLADAAPVRKLLSPRNE